MLSDEREKEIRFHAEQFHHNFTSIEDCDAEKAIWELLAEIDRLRAELETEHTEGLRRVKLIEERDDLLEKVKIYERQGARDRLEYAAKLEKENQSLRAENEELKTKFTWLREKLESRVTELNSRIEKLRERFRNMMVAPELIEDDECRWRAKNALAHDDSAPNISAPGPNNSYQQLTNTGHGHVRPRADGVRARCGGPGICSECALEKAKIEKKE